MCKNRAKIKRKTRSKSFRSGFTFYFSSVFIHWALSAKRVKCKFSRNQRLFALSFSIRTLSNTALDPFYWMSKNSTLAFPARRCFFSSKQTEMVQRYYAYAISPLDNYEWTMRHRSLWRHRYLDWKCYYVYSYLRRNQKKLSFEKSYKNITGSSL